MRKYHGGCQCGAIRYKIDGDPLQCFVCHCTDCQRAMGGGPAFEVLFRAEGFAIVAGEPRVTWTHGVSGKRVGRYFCSDCGTPVFGEIEMLPGTRDVPVGSLDDKGFYAPEMHMWVKSAPPWHHIASDLPHYAGNPSDTGAA